jgi:hypothetical protein
MPDRSGKLTDLDEAVVRLQAAAFPVRRTFNGFELGHQDFGPAEYRFGGCKREHDSLIHLTVRSEGQVERFVRVDFCEAADLVIAARALGDPVNLEPGMLERQLSDLLDRLRIEAKARGWEVEE